MKNLLSKIKSNSTATSTSRGIGKKMIALALSGLTILSLATGCGSSNGGASTTAAPAGETKADASSAAPASEAASASQAADASKAAAPAGDKHFKIGVIQFADHPSLDNCYKGFVEGLADEGFVDGQNITIEKQSGQADTATTNQIADSFVSQGMDLICGIATPAAQAAYNAASKKNIPVIFNAVTDPVAAELANPDGSAKKGITGVSDALPIDQQLQMVRAFLPEAKKIGILYSTSEVNSASSLAKYKELAPKYGFEIVDSGINAAADVPLATDQLLGKVDCLTNLTDNLVVQNLATILNKAMSKKIPYFGSEIEQVANGCLAAEGLDYVELGRQTGVMAARVLKGEAPESMPFETIKNSVAYYNPETLAKLGLKLPAAYEGKIKDATKAVEK